jgi:multisubunit Na+/H+ antiporter MnhF subunit
MEWPLSFKYFSQILSCLDFVRFLIPHSHPDKLMARLSLNIILSLLIYIFYHREEFMSLFVYVLAVLK